MDEKIDMKVIFLPDKENMLERLLSVSDDNHLQEKFYPLLLKYAGEEKFVQGIVSIFIIAIYTYTKDFAKDFSLSSKVSSLLYRMPNFIDALIDDEEARQRIKDTLQEGIQDITD